MNKKELEQKIRDAGFDRGELIGYQTDTKNGFIFPMFKPKNDPHDEPTSGGNDYYDPKEDKWGFMLLLDIIDLDLETTMY